MIGAQPGKYQIQTQESIVPNANSRVERKNTNAMIRQIFTAIFCWYSVNRISTNPARPRCFVRAKIPRFEARLEVLRPQSDAAVRRYDGMSPLRHLTLLQSGFNNDMVTDQSLSFATQQLATSTITTTSSKSKLNDSPHSASRAGIGMGRSEKGDWLAALGNHSQCAKRRKGYPRSTRRHAPRFDLYSNQLGRLSRSSSISTENPLLTTAQN